MKTEKDLSPSTPSQSKRQKENKEKRSFRSCKLLETNKGHWYFVKEIRCPDGVFLPSSTNILDFFPKPGLKFWLENTSPEEIAKKQEDGKRQGSKVHHCCFLASLGRDVATTGLTAEDIQLLPITGDDHKLINNLKEPLTSREINCLEGFSNYWDEFKPVTIGREVTVYSLKYGFAGTLDWYGYLWDKKKKKYEFWIIDYKISKSHDVSYDCQVSSYNRALKELSKKKINPRLGILYLGKSTKKKFQIKEITNKQEAFKAFLETKKLWEFINPNAKPSMVTIEDKVFPFEENPRKGRMLKNII